MLKTICDEFNRIYEICTFSQSSYFLQEVGLCGECDLDDDDDDEILGCDYRRTE